MEITLIVIPGSGAKTLTYPAGTSLETLVSQYNLQDRNIVVDGTGVAKSDYASFTLRDSMEVFATSAVKGA